MCIWVLGQLVQPVGLVPLGKHHVLLRPVGGFAARGGRLAVCATSGLDLVIHFHVAILTLCRESKDTQDSEGGEPGTKHAAGKGDSP